MRSCEMIPRIKICCIKIAHQKHERSHKNLQIIRKSLCFNILPAIDRSSLISYWKSRNLGLLKIILKKRNFTSSNKAMSQTRSFLSVEPGSKMEYS